MNDILVAGPAGKKLLVVAGPTYFYACDLYSSEVVWNNCNIAGMEKHFWPFCLSTDGRGHLYVLDRNNDCVHMFSVDDGSHMGVVLSKEDGLSCFHDVSWCEEKASLAVLCIKNGKACIVLYKINHGGENVSIVLTL